MATFQQVGRFRVTAAVDPRRKTSQAHINKQGGNLVSYFCTPDMEVIHMLVGPVTPETLMEGADWAIATHKSIQEIAGNRTSEQVAAFRNAHFDHVTDTTWKHFQLLAASSPGYDRSKPIAVRTETVADAVIAMRIQSRGQGLGTTTAAQSHALQQSCKLTAQDPSSREFEHLFLGELGLAQLADIQRAVFTTLAGEYYSPRTARSDELIAQVGQAKLERKATLMVVGASPPPLGLISDDEAASLLPLDRSGQRMLESMQSIWLSEDELTLLLDDLDEIPLDLALGCKPRYVLYDRQGTRSAVVTDRDSPVELKRRLREAIVRNPDGEAGE